MESPETGKTLVKTIALERRQMRWEAMDLESLIAADHPARTIWELSGRFDLSRFEKEQKTREGQAGRPCWSARLLVSLWVYSYTLGVASARAIERMMSHEPGLRWLAAGLGINHHTLGDFRVGNQEGLEELFAQFLALLDSGIGGSEHAAARRDKGQGGSGEGIVSPAADVRETGAAGAQGDPEAEPADGGRRPGGRGIGAAGGPH